MNKTTDFKPNWASLPGNTIAEILHERKISLESFADDMRTSISSVNDLIHGHIQISKNIATKLETALGSTAEFWLQRESQYREALERLKVEEDAKWIKELPIKDMLNFGWINKAKDMVSECLSFFNVSDVAEWRAKYSNESANFAFRNSTAYKSESAAVAVWLRQGEISSEKINCKSWNEDLFEKALHDLRALTKKKNPQEFLPELITKCADCGVSVAIVRTPTGCRASGATRFVSDKKAMLLLSFRYLSDDQFWFTFFHEAGHLILHKNKNIILEDKENKFESEIEREANLFAKEMLIPHQYHTELSKLKGNKRAIIGFASKLGISPGIVVGQLQHAGYVDPKNMNYYKRFYNWDDILS